MKTYYAASHAQAEMMVRHVKAGGFKAVMGKSNSFTYEPAAEKFISDYINACFV